jgi:hypothetical protein
MSVSAPDRTATTTTSAPLVAVRVLTAGIVLGVLLQGALAGGFLSGSVTGALDLHAIVGDRILPLLSFGGLGLSLVVADLRRRRALVGGLAVTSAGFFLAIPSGYIGGAVLMVHIPIAIVIVLSAAAALTASLRRA